MKASAATGNASGSLGAGAAIATKHDEQTGADTTIYKVFAEAAADLDLLTVGASGAVKGTSALEVTREKGQVTKLSISSAVETSAAVNVASGDLKDVTKKIKQASGKLSSGKTKLVQTDIQLDVDDRNREIVETYLNSGATNPDAAGDLARELDRSGQMEVNVYDRQVDGFEFQLKGEGFGVEGKSETTTDGLLSSSVKPPGDPEYHRRRPR
jgi:hypothetical protein